MNKITRVYEYATNKILATVPTSKFNAWCSLHGYLPHHKTSSGWVVIK